MSSSSLSTLTRNVGAQIGPTLSRQKGRLGRPFEALIKHAGAAVVNDVVTLEMALEVGLRGGDQLGNQARVDDAFRAINGLWSQAEGLTGRVGERVRFELLHRWRRAEALQEKSLRVFDVDAVAAIQKLDATRAAGKPLFKPGVAAAAKKFDPSVGRTLAELDHTLSKPGTDSVLVTLWDFVRIQVGTGRGIEEMARQASDSSAAVWKILKEKGVKAGEQELWGHVSKVRGHLGEALAFTDKVVLADRDSAFAAAQEAARRLGPGHDAVWLTQVENGIRYADGGEGPDALILIRNSAKGEAYVHTAYQVKVAKTSEGFTQSVNDVYREAGVFRAGGWDRRRGTVTFTPPGRVDEVTVELAESSQVQRRAVVVNFKGSTNEGVRDLKAAGFIVDEKVLGMSVDQATHLAVSIQQAAVSEGLASGRLKP